MTGGSDVLVVGAGAAGAAIACALTTSGACVTVIRPPELAGEAWRASAGMLAAQVEPEIDDPLFNLGIAGRDQYPEEAGRLHAATGIDVGFASTGILQLAFTPARADRLRAKVTWQREQAQSAEWLESEIVGERWPRLAGCTGAFWAPGDATIDSRRLVEARLAWAGRFGAAIVTDSISAIEKTGNRIVGATGRLGRYPADAVVIAAGAWSGRIANLPRPLSVEPIRGQIAAYHWPRDDDDTTVYGNHCYLLHRGDELWIGSTMEHAGFTVVNTDSGLGEVIRRVSEVYPPITSMQPIRTWSGLRPGTPDGLPIIGEEPGLAGLWYAAGYGRNGILLSGIVSQHLARGIGGEPLPSDFRHFRPERFWPY